MCAMIRNFILATSISLASALPAKALDLIINYQAQADVDTFAKQLGYYDAANKAMVPGGPIGGGGAFAISPPAPFVITQAVMDFTQVPPVVVTPAVMAPGLWFRLHHVGDPSVVLKKMTPAVLAAAAKLNIAIYQFAPALNSGAGCWSSDGATCGPDYIDKIGTFM